MMMMMTMVIRMMLVMMMIMMLLLSSLVCSFFFKRSSMLSVSLNRFESTIEISTNNERASDINTHTHKDIENSIGNDGSGSGGGRYLPMVAIYLRNYARTHTQNTHCTYVEFSLLLLLIVVLFYLVACMLVLVRSGYK